MQQTSLFTFITEVRPTLGGRHEAVMEAFGTGREFTNRELATWLGWEINTVTPRVFELREKGLVEESCKRTCRDTGRTAISWKLAEKNNVDKF